jgi:hypothetical protein
MRGVLAFALVVACSSPLPPDRSDPQPTDASQCAPQDQNSYGVCYPTQSLGGSVGDRFGDAALTTASRAIRLGDFYDPQQAGVPDLIGGVPIRLIHVTVGAMGSTATNVEADFITGSNVTGQNPNLVAWATEFAPEGVVFIVAFVDGPVDGVSATLTDLAAWIAARNVSQAIPAIVGAPSLESLVPVVDVDIDGRSMQILDEAPGGDPTIDQTVESALEWVSNNPPQG